MIEMVAKAGVGLLDVPNGKDSVWGIVLPYFAQPNKDGIITFATVEANKAGRTLNLHRKLTEYVEKWGAKSFYLGSFAKCTGEVVRIFALPTQFRPRDLPDLTTIVRGCESLVGLTNKFPVGLCILPMLVSEENAEFHFNCAQACMELILNDSFVVLHREPKDY